ncbi:MAG: class I SAM-dependent methyltransferase [Chloroflexota bacterium]
MSDTSGADVYERIAALYDWEHDRFDDDLPFYRALALRTGDPILELACGSGRVLADLARLGHRCIGVDASPAMLERARRRLVERGHRAELIQASMQEFRVPEPARLALIPLDSFGHLLDQDDQLQTLEAARAALQSDGVLVIDLANGNNRGEPQDELVHHLTAEAVDGAGLITKWVSRTTDPSEQIDELMYWYDATGADDLVRRTTVQFSLRYFTRFELTLLLERAGFEVEALYGSYDLEPFAALSERLIAVARPQS